MGVISLRGDLGDFVEVEVLGSKFPDATDSWGTSWLRARVRAGAEGAAIEFLADLQVSDLEAFVDEVRHGPPDDALGVIALQTHEGGITIFLIELPTSAGYEVECTLSPAGDDFPPHFTHTLTVSRENVLCAAAIAEDVLARLSGTGLFREPDLN